MSRRKRITATIKMTFTDDSDLIAWWQSIPLGSRNVVMKDIIREHIAREGGHYCQREVPVISRASTFDENQLAQVRDDTAWIRDMLQDIPAYLEQLIRAATAMQSVAAAASARAAIRDGPALSAHDKSAREANMRKHRW